MKKVNSLLKNISNKNILLIISALYIVWLFKSYDGNQHSNSLNLFKFILGSNSYINDIGIQNSLFFKSSILFKIVEIFKINLDNDIVGFLIHIILSTISGFFLFLILKKFLKLTNINFIFIFLFLSMVVSDILVLGTGGKSGWVSQTNFSLTYFGQNLRFIFIYFLLAENFIGLILITPILLLISVKSTIMTVVCGIFYSIFFYKNKKKLLWLITPALIFFYFLAISNFQLTFNEKVFAIDTMLKWDREEVAFHLQPISHLLALVVSFIIFSFLLIYSQKNKFRNFALIVFIISLCNFIFSYIYLKFLYSYLPLPEIVMFGPPRLMELYQIVFWIFFAYFFYKLKISNLKKILIFAAIFYLFLGTKGLTVSLIILSAFLFLHLARNKININNNSAILVFLILIAPSIFYLGYQRYNNNFNHYSFAAINKWTLGYNKIGKERIDLALNLQKCEDFIFIPTIMLKNLNLGTDFFTLSIAGKSGFTGHPVLNNLNIKYLKEVENRKSLLDELYLNLNQKKIISKKILENLREYNVVILIDKRFEDQFPSYIKLYKVSETERLFSIMENKKEFKFEKNCIKKIF
tara:strand:+ start:2077 stop:3816 length:1740 start_codon:yes stop_codon:yes gene_type:complete